MYMKFTISECFVSGIEPIKIFPVFNTYISEPTLETCLEGFMSRHFSAYKVVMSTITKKTPTVYYTAISGVISQKQNN